MPPPELPKPAVKALALPTTFLSKNPVDHTWQGTKDPPRIPTKNRIANKPDTLVTAPARAVGIDPASKQAANVTLGPNRSHAGPAARRTSRLTMRHQPYSSCENQRLLRCNERNDVRVGDISGAEVQILCNGNCQLQEGSVWLVLAPCRAVVVVLTSGGKAYL